MEKDMDMTQTGSWAVIFGCGYHGYQLGGCECGADSITRRGTLGDYRKMVAEGWESGFGEFCPDPMPQSEK